MDDLRTSAFAFILRLDPVERDHDVAFQEVSGLDLAVETVAVRQGGENRFVQRLPGEVRHGPLLLKRATVGPTSLFALWIKSTLEGTLSAPIITRDLTLDLVDGTGAALYRWTFSGCYPVRWSIDTLSTDTAQIAIDQLSLSYNEVVRTVPG